MLRLRLAALGLLLILTGVSPVSADPPDLPLDHERFVLPNGLTVIVNENPASPVVYVLLRYRIGSGSEPEGQTGFAHLFEHLMFNGSEHHDSDWFAPLEAVGATDINGRAGSEATTYQMMVPPAALDRALWLESDRMGYLVGAITQAKLDQQRSVVQNEKREGENRPLGTLFQKLNRALFPLGHPYHHPTIGSMVDLDAASLDQVRRWFKDYYGPNNAILVLSGNIDGETARTKAERFFGGIPAGSDLSRFTSWVPDRRTNTHEISYDRVEVAHVYRAWPAPGATTRDHALLTLAAKMVGGGRTSPLQATLIYDRKVATHAFASISQTYLASTFLLWAELKPGVDTNLAVSAFDESIAKLLEGQMSKSSLADAVRGVRSDFLTNMNGIGQRAELIASGEQFAGDPAFLDRYMKWIDEATLEQVRDAAKRWLSAGWHQIDTLPQGKYSAAASTVDRAAGLPAVPQEVPTQIVPVPEEATLSNGMRLIVARREDATLANVTLQFDAGNASDPAGEPGLASFAFELLDEGTTTRTAEAIAEAQARMGVDLTISQDLDSSSIQATVPGDQLAGPVGLIADMVRNPGSDIADISRLKDSRLAKLIAESADPQQIATRMARRILFGTAHGYAIPRSGLADAGSTRSIDRADLLAYRGAWIRPEKAVILVTGNVTMAQVRPIIERAFGDWRGSPDVSPGDKNLSEVAAPARPRIILVDRPGAPQSLIFGATVVPGAAGEDELAIQIANTILGGGFTSRINTNLRQEKGWSYGAGTGMADAVGQRMFQVSAPVQTDKTAEALAELIAELKAIGSDRPITQAERDATVTAAIRGLPGQFAHPFSIVASLRSASTLGRPLDWPNSLAMRYNNVNLKAVRAAVGSIVLPDRMLWIIVGDRTKIESGINKLMIAPIEHMAAEAQP